LPKKFTTGGKYYGYAVYTSLALGIIVTVLFLYVRVKRGGVDGVIVKTLASVFFVLTAVLGSLANPAVKPEFYLLMILGLVFGLIGDIVLDLKVDYTKDNDK